MPAVDITLANPPPDSCPADVTALFALIRVGLSGNIAEASTPYVVQAGTPSVGEQDYIWFKLDGGGRPLGIFKYYNGNWRSVYTGRTSEVSMFSGDPSSLFDETGKGVLGLSWDGWALMNGNNGTVDLSDKFIVSGHMNNSGSTLGYSAGWRTTVAGAAASTGGAGSFTSTAANTYRPARGEVIVYEAGADGNQGRDGGPLYGAMSVPGVAVSLLAGDAGNLAPTAIPIIPPFFALAYCKFIGYT